MRTSLSSRAHMETHTLDGEWREDADPDWVRYRTNLNKLFFWQEDHTRIAWLEDFNRYQDKFSAHIPKAE